MASKSGQYPGTGFTSAKGNGESRGTDPALAGHYITREQLRGQGPTPGKDQLKDPSEPTPMTGGQFPGIKQGLFQVNDPEVVRNTGPQPRTTVAPSGGQFPGVSQSIEGLGGGSDANDAKSIEKNEGSDLNLRGVGADIGSARTVEKS